jgi:hypothetical protein
MSGVNIETLISGCFIATQKGGFCYGAGAELAAV